MRNFLTVSKYQEYEQDCIVLVIEFKHSTFYISNQEKPIIKNNRAVFKNVLFASTCMELFSFGFLLVKLIVLPLSHLVVRRLRSKKSEKQEKSENEDEKNEEEGSKKEKDEDEDDDDDEDDDVVGPVQRERETGVNHWYVPEARY